MDKGIKKIFDKLKDEQRKHLCFIMDGEELSVSMACTHEDFCKFIVSLMQNQPWVAEALEEIVDSFVDYDDDEPEDNQQYLN